MNAKVEMKQEEKHPPPSSMQDIDKVMHDMDRLYNSNFTDWIRDESNLSYICTIKRPVFMREYRLNPKLGIEAIKWITEHWALTSIMEFLLKMFPYMTIDGPEFVHLVSDLTSDWSLDKVKEMIKLLLVGESATTCARFIYCFKRISRSEQTDILVFLSDSLGWDSSFLRLFLLDYSMLIDANGIEHRALIVLIHQSMDEIDYQYKEFEVNNYSQDEIQEKSMKSGIDAPPTSPIGSPIHTGGWESNLKSKEGDLIRKLVSIQEFKVFLALFEVIMDIHEKHDTVSEDDLTNALIHELEL